MSSQRGLRPFQRSLMRLSHGSGRHSSSNYISHHGNNSSIIRHLSTHPSKNDSFLSASSSLYIESMLERYEQDPDSVPESWRTYFEMGAADASTSSSGEEAMFNQPTIVLSSGNLKNARNTNLVSQST